jgi:putative ABC transport system substrate-binding protein
MRRRAFITLLGNAAIMAYPLAARAQQAERMRRVGVLMLYEENDPEAQVRVVAFRQGLEKPGWSIGRNLQIDFHWGVGDVDWIRSAAARMLRAAPDVIVANGGAALRPMQQATRTLPIVFIGAADPVADGFVQSLAHPGGNITGFTTLEPSIGAKFLALLKEIAPRVRRAAIMVSPDSPSSRRLSDVAAAAAPKLTVEVVVAPVRGAADIEAAMMEWSREPDFGLIVPPDPTINSHRKLIIELAARYRLPAIHALRAATAEGALMSYGISVPELFRQAATYVDRLLKGEKPADLPVQQPTRFELAINLKTAKALGLAVPQTLLVAADEVIE